MTILKKYEYYFYVYIIFNILPRLYISNLFTFFKKKQKDCTKLKFVHIHLLSRLILKCDFKLFCLQSFAFYLRHASHL